jgi:hypothetical protein
MGYGRSHQQGPNGDLYRAVVTEKVMKWEPGVGYSDTGETKEVVFGPYTTRHAARSSASYPRWGHVRVGEPRIEKLVSPTWAPVNKSSEIILSESEYLELLALRARA